MRNLLTVIAAVAALACAGAPIAQPRLVTVDAENNISPHGVLATVGDAARIEAQVVANEEAVVAQEAAYAIASNIVDTLVSQIAQQQVVILEDDFVYSLGDANNVSTNCICSIKTYDHTVSGGNSVDTLVFGFTEDIGSLNPVGQLKYSLAVDSVDWQEVTCSTPVVVPNGTFTRGDVEFSHVYQVTVTYPAQPSAFIRVYTEITAQTGDGAELDLVGGIAGGWTGTDGDGCRIVGGLNMGPAQ